MQPKTLLPGIAKSRMGSPSIGFQTLIDRTKRAAFFDELTKLSEGPSRAEVAAANKELKKPVEKRLLNPIESGAIAGSASPVVQAMGRGLKGAINGATHETGELAGKKMTRMAAAMHGVRGTTKGDIASSALISAMGVGALAAGRDGMAFGRAKKTLHDAAVAKEHAA